MAKTITIKLTGLAEIFIDEMKKQGLTEADVISQGIGLLEEVWRTNRVALVKEAFWRTSRQNVPDAFYNDERVLEHYFHVQTPKTMHQQEPLNSIENPG